MQLPTTRQLADSLPIRIPAKSVVLLIFMPSVQTDQPQRKVLTALADSLQQHLGDQMRILRIDQATHPDVVRSFAITHTPTFVLVRQGIELWRQVGMPDKAFLTHLSQLLLNN